VLSGWYQTNYGFVPVFLTTSALSSWRKVALLVEKIVQCLLAGAWRLRKLEADGHGE